MSLRTSPTQTYEGFFFSLRKKYRLFSNSTRKPYFDCHKNGFYSVNIDAVGEDEEIFLPTAAQAYARTFGWGAKHASYPA